MKIFRRFFVPFLALFLLIVIIVNTFILYYSINSKPKKSDVIIILGCQLWGKSPSPMLDYRLKEALKLYKKGYADKIIVSGGQGNDEIMPEAQLMKSWLVKRGVNSNKIFEENKSKSTYENIKFSKRIMDQQGLKTVILVSNDFHIFRSLKIAKSLNIIASGAPAPTVPHLKLLYQCRETLSVIKNTLLNR